MAQHSAGTQCGAVSTLSERRLTVPDHVAQAARARKEQARLARIAAEEAEREEVCMLVLTRRLVPNLIPVFTAGIILTTHPAGSADADL